ncbi:rhamnulokinase [Lachnospiraceae bacterium KM106-2]|nr:rhamnulokinase [Lachnospiraceae bacterium KM106-2]
MEKYYLAIDIGASSGRHILAHKKNGKMKLEEIYRFPNGLMKKDGELCWDIDQLYTEIKTGMKECVKLNKIPVSVGIDTWAVDFVLLDAKGQRIGNPVAYRDGRTKGMDERVYSFLSEEKLYQRIGIQKQIFNSIYQLMAIKENHPEQMEQAEKMLMIPDYFHSLLCGKTVTEYTNATTTSLVDPETNEWDMELIDLLGFKKEIFQEIKMPGTVLGDLSEEIQKEVGFNCKVVLPATHDTGSAVMAVPSNKDDVLYISSGTWSLMGTELAKANCSKESRQRNFTNEGGYDHRFRFLKNIMGLWMIQNVKKEIGEGLSFGEICDLASKETITSIVDCNDDRFLAPDSMTEEVKKACKESNQDIPNGVGQVASVIYRSLAKCYADTIDEIEEITKCKYDTVHIVGGGANADYLNRLTANETKRTIYAGPTEATAIGNIAAQMIAEKELEDLTEARSCIRDSFPLKQYDPQ